MSTTEINLIQGDSKRQGVFARVEGKLRLFAWVSLGLLFAAGMIVGGTYLFARTKLTSLEDTNVRLIRDINVQSVKEGLLLSLSERVSIAAKALDAAKPWGKLFTTLSSIAVEESFSSVAVDETSRALVTLDLSSLEEAVGVIQSLMVLVNERSLRSPQMNSFSLNENGRVQMSISFYQIF